MLIAGMELYLAEEQINFLLQEIDPYNNNKMTYSEIVQLLSSQMVPSGDDPNYPATSIPILEKFSLITEQQNHPKNLVTSEALASEYGSAPHEQQPPQMHHQQYAPEHHEDLHGDQQPEQTHKP